MSDIYDYAQETPGLELYYINFKPMSIVKNTGNTFVRNLFSDTEASIDIRQVITCFTYSNVTSKMFS